MREMGMGVVVEYAGQRGAAQWSNPNQAIGTIPSLVPIWHIQNRIIGSI